MQSRSAKCLELLYPLVDICIYKLPMNNLIISQAIAEKLKSKHCVSIREIEQCFENRCGNYVVDTREGHKTEPVTLWFVAATNHNRILKIMFVYRDGKVYLKSAYEAKESVIEIYERRGK